MAAVGRNPQVKAINFPSSVRGKQFCISTNAARNCPKGTQLFTASDSEGNGCWPPDAVCQPACPWPWFPGRPPSMAGCLSPPRMLCELRVPRAPRPVVCALPSVCGISHYSEIGNVYAVRGMFPFHSFRVSCLSRLVPPQGHVDTLSSFLHMLLLLG